MPKYRAVATMDVGYEAIIDAPDMDTAYKWAKDGYGFVKWKKVDDGHDWALEFVEHDGENYHVKYTKTIQDYLGETEGYVTEYGDGTKVKDGVVYPPTVANPREETDRLLEMVEEGLIDPKLVVLMCVKYMSEADVADMMDCNELSERFMEEEDE